MAYYTADELREQAGGLTASAARAQLAHAATAPPATYDIFLSHSVNDDVLVLGLKNELERMRLTVYVDWLEDPELDRERVSPATAMKLRQRMRSCRALIYATSSNASTSRWMPWELGYFDGRQGETKIAICPVEAGGCSIQRLEYLGIYKRLEPVEHDGRVFPYVLRPHGTEGESVESFVHGRDQYRGIIRNN